MCSFLESLSRQPTTTTNAVQPCSVLLAAYDEHRHCHLITVPVETENFKTDDEYVAH